MTDTARHLHVPDFAKAEIAAMQTRRTALLAEMSALPKSACDRAWDIEAELDNMDDRLNELGISLDVLS